jgi:hypothetical protein
MVEIKLGINCGYNIHPSFSGHLLVNSKLFHSDITMIELLLGLREYVLLQLYTSPRDVVSGSQLDISDKHLKAMLANKDREIISLKIRLEVSNIVIYRVFFAVTSKKLQVLGSFVLYVYGFPSN